MDEGKGERLIHQTNGNSNMGHEKKQHFRSVGSNKKRVDRKLILSCPPDWLVTRLSWDYWINSTRSGCGGK